MNDSSEWYAVNESEVMQFADALPDLVHLDLYEYRFTIKNAVYLLNHLKSFEPFCFAADDRFNRNDFIDELKRNGLQLKSIN